MMKKRRVFPILLASVLALPLVLNGCSSDSDGHMFGSTGLLSVEIHDHPMPEIAECWVTIDRVEARQLQGAWNHVAGEYPQRFDLLQLQNGATRVLGSGAVPSGDYDRIRLNLTAVHLVMRDGEQVDVPMPAGGLPVHVPIGQRCEVFENAGANVSIDFRIPTSFQHDADEGWSCNPDVVVDGVWQHGQPSPHDQHGQPG